VCPVIGSIHRESLRATADIATQLRENLVAAIRADADPSAVEIDRRLDETLVALEAVDVIRASESLQAAAAVGWQCAGHLRSVCRGQGTARANVQCGVD